PLVLWAHAAGNTKAIEASSALSRQVAIPGLEDGSVFASVSFRHPYLNSDIGAPRTDIARAVQFLRCHARAFGLDPERFAAIGSSRGTLAVWTAVQDDLADPTSPDPVLRQSTRLRGVFGNQAQTSYWGEWIADTFIHPSLRDR